jgi:hypothetical protein
MRRTATQLVPLLLTNDQKQRRINMCFELREKAKEDSTFIFRIITGDKSWIYSYDPEARQQSVQRKSPQLPRAKKKKTALQVRSSTKSILYFFMKGIFHLEFFPPNTVVNSDFYYIVLRCLEKMCNEKDHNYGATTTGSIIMMCLSTHH